MSKRRGPWRNGMLTNSERKTENRRIREHVGVGVTSYQEGQGLLDPDGPWLGVLSTSAAAVNKRQLGVGSAGRTRTYDQSVNSRPLYH